MCGRARVGEILARRRRAAALQRIPRRLAGAGALSRKRRVERVETVSLVEDLDHEGRGVAHHEGKAVFIPDALPGERVRWSLAQRHRNFDEARLLEVLEPAASRVTPRC